MRRLFAKLSLAAILVLSALPHYAGAADSHAQRDSIERALPAEQFCRCHNSYIVNLDCVDSISRTAVDLRGGQRLPVGRTYYKRLQSSFIRYMNQ